MIDKLKNLAVELVSLEISEQSNLLLNTAAMLILAEEIKNLATTGVTLAQATQDFTDALNKLGTDIDAAVQVLKNTGVTNNNPDAANAIATLEVGADKLKGVDATLLAAIPQPPATSGGVPSTPVTATQTAPSGTPIPGSGSGS